MGISDVKAAQATNKQFLLGGHAELRRSNRALKSGLAMPIHKNGKVATMPAAAFAIGGLSTHLSRKERGKGWGTVLVGRAKKRPGQPPNKILDSHDCQRQVYVSTQTELDAFGPLQ